jgi:hypothetical protein
MSPAPVDQLDCPVPHRVFVNENKPTHPGCRLPRTRTASIALTFLPVRRTVEAEEP